MIDYLDEDVAYLLGLIIGRGQIIEKEDSFNIIIDFPFRQEEIEGENQFQGFVASITSKVVPRLTDLLGYGSVSVKSNEDNQEVSLNITLNPGNMIVRNIKLLLENKLSYPEYRIPSVIKSINNEEILIEFIRGFCDVSANIRKSNRDRNGFHRVYIDILFSNWYLPVEICNLLQEKLGVNVSNILWGHPNLRGGNMLGREHQMRIYAHEYLKIGFYITFKEKILGELAEENQKLIEYGKKDPSRKCPGHGQRYKVKESSDLENSEKLPQEIRGKHFNAYWEICAEMGCENARNYIKEKRKTPLFTELEENREE